MAIQSPYFIWLDQNEPVFAGFGPKSQLEGLFRAEIFGENLGRVSRNDIFAVPYERALEREAVRGKLTIYDLRFADHRSWITVRKFIERRTGSMIRDLRKVVDDEAR